MTFDRDQFKLSLRLGDLRKAKSIMDKFPDVINDRFDENGNSALHYALSYGHINVAKVMLANPNVDVNIEDKVSLVCEIHKDSPLLIVSSFLL
jgi:ankyrin repeat protein